MDQELIVLPSIPYSPSAIQLIQTFVSEAACVGLQAGDVELWPPQPRRKVASVRQIKSRQQLDDRHLSG